MEALSSASKERPWMTWCVERMGSTLLMLLFLWMARSCWRTARANQKLALGDALEYSAAERRGLLLPMHRDRR